MGLRALLCAMFALVACAEAPAEAPPPLRTPQLRGVIEGFYGDRYEEEDRIALFESLPAYGFSAYFYGPKDDPFHRDAFREPYPAADLAHFADLVSRGETLGVRFVFTVSPGLSFDPGSGDLVPLLAKLDALAELGVRDFCLFFDDLYPSSPGADPEVLVRILLDVRRHLRERVEGASLCFTPPYYFGTAASLAADGTRVYPLALPLPSSAHYAAYASLPRDIAIFWTGTGVFSSELTEADLTEYRAFVGRPVFLWDNFPVNDTVLANELFLGPYVGRTSALSSALDGVVLNLAQQPRASRVALATAAASLRDGSAYDPEAAWSEALASLGGSALPALRSLAEHLSGHPLVSDRGEAVRLAALVRDFSSAPSTETSAALRTELVALAAVRDALETSLADARLAAELAPFAGKLEGLADAALLALDAYDATVLGTPPDLTSLDAAIAAARAAPEVVGANTLIAPFLAGILGDGVPMPHVDVWADLFTAVRDATLAALP